MFDAEIGFLRFLEGFRTPALNTIFEYLTMLGEETIMLLIVITLWFAVDRNLARRIVFITAISLGANSIIKNLTKIPRPWIGGRVSCVRPDTATGYSFPSGHTQTFATWSTGFALRFKKWWFALVVGGLIFLVAFSRLFLGAHYPSDVAWGIIFGVAFAFLGNMLFDKVGDKQKLFLGLTIFFLPFAVFFLIKADPLFEDLFKFCGLLVGLLVACPIEERFAPLNYSVKWWKKAVRVVFGVILAYVLKESFDPGEIFGVVRVSLVMETVKYLLLVVVVFGIYPILIKKCKM